MDADVIRREYEHRYPARNSRYMAYCHAAGKSPADPPDNGAWAVWITNAVARARKEMDKHHGTLTTEEKTKCTEIMWRYAVEERG